MINSALTPETVVQKGKPYFQPFSIPTGIALFIAGLLGWKAGYILSNMYEPYTVGIAVGGLIFALGLFSLAFGQLILMIRAMVYYRDNWSEG